MSMSWFSEMADKAETFLNRMDQTAAAALSGSMIENQSSDSISQEKSSAVIPHLVTYQPRYTPTPVSAAITAHSRNSSIGSSFSTVSSRDIHSNGTQIVPSIFTSTPNVSRGSNRSRTDQDEEKMFEFLNSKPESTSSKRQTSRNSPRRSDEEQSIASIEVVSVSSDEGRAGHLASGKGSPTVSDGGKSETSDPDPHFQPTHPEIKEVEAHDVDKEDSKAVILTLEKEISRLTQRCLNAEAEVKRLSKRLENWQNQLSTSDASLRELQALEQDLRSAIKVRDESISILKVRLQESDELLKAKTEAQDALRMQFDLLLKENAEAQASRDQNADALRNRISELEQELLTEKETLQKVQSDSMAQMGLLEENNRVLVDELGSAQRELRSEKLLRKETEKQLKQVKSSFDSLTAEFEEYKNKAVKTLQSKEDLIRNLQRKSHDGDEGIADTNDFQIGFEESNSQTLVLQSQCDALVQEVQELQSRNESLKAELDRVKSQELEELTTRLSVISDEREEERRLRSELESELRQVQDELRYSREDFERVKTSLQTRMQDKDREVEQLRKQLVAKRNTVADTSIQELEQRCRGLTQSLIQKQTLVEQLSSERHSLALQLERSDARLRSLMEENRSQMSSPSVSIGMSNSMPTSSSLINRSGNRAVFDESPDDGQVTRRVKQVYNQFDSFSIRIGQFLRVYPPARAFILIYILFLHLWVFIVLFSYRPEMHEMDP